jgi:isopentenyl diphosphate isomerase/L-lactate dehydrogenase-like FMN-dependent dehydrogenase
LSWDHIDMLRRHWRGNFVIKGILRADDARRAHQHGADGIVVSNHGGRNLDSAVSTAEVLPRIADAVGGDMTVLCDSGVQRGSDVVKLLALGADAVMAGRAFLYATAWGGQAGAAKMMSILDHEIDITMAMTGCRSLADITPDLLF